MCGEFCLQRIKYFVGIDFSVSSDLLKSLCYKIVKRFYDLKVYNRHFIVPKYDFNFMYRQNRLAITTF